MIKREANKGKSSDLGRKNEKAMSSNGYHLDISFLHDLHPLITLFRIQSSRGNKVSDEPGLSKNCTG